jgi:hypothetical protein
MLIKMLHLKIINKGGKQMYKTNIETLLRIKSVIKVNEKFESVEPGEYVVHELVVSFDKPHMKTKSKNVTYFLENLANSNRDDCLTEADINDGIAKGAIEIVNDAVVSYKVEYHDITNGEECIDYVYVKSGVPVSNEYFETRIERAIEIEDINPIKLKKHDITITSYTLCLR